MGWQRSTGSTKAGPFGGRDMNNKPFMTQVNSFCFSLKVAVVRGPFQNKYGRSVVEIRTRGGNCGAKTEKWQRREQEARCCHLDTLAATLETSAVH